MSKPIVLYSGGLDSTVLLWSLRPHVKALMFNYGQRHNKELAYSAMICNTHKIEYEVADLTMIKRLISSGSQTGNEPVPEGHYTAENMKTTIVPNRNMIMASIAVGWAVSTGSTDVYAAMHAGDHAIYPDCREEFILPFQQACKKGNTPPIYFWAPFLSKTKAEIVKLGAQLNAPLDQTWSCYKGRALHCGKCGTCVERREAFILAGVNDPTEYEE